MADRTGLGPTIGRWWPTASSSHTAPSAPTPRICATSRQCDSQLDGLARICGEWLARKGLRARTVTLKVRYDDFCTVTRSLSSTGGVHDTTTVTAHAQQLLDRTDAQMRPVRLLGVSVHNLVDPSADVVVDEGLLPFDESGTVA